MKKIISTLKSYFSGELSWAHGSSMINYMKLIEFNGLSGFVQFDSQGIRTNFNLDIMELQSTGLEPIGTWNQLTSLNLTRVNSMVEFYNPANIMSNKTFVVTTVAAPPYTMLTEQTKVGGK